MKILVTGGAGYIGSVLVEKLLNWTKFYYTTLESGYSGPGWYRPVVTQLTVVDTLARGQNTLGDIIQDPRVEFVKTSVTDWETMDPLYRSHDVIIPLAGIVGAPRCHTLFKETWLLNNDVIETLCVNMLDTYEKSGIKLLYPCTNSGYGTRSDGKPVTEEELLTPISVYGQSKVAAESIIRSYGGVSLRLATVMGYSPCMRLDLLVNTFVWKAVKERSIVLFEKHMKRNYIHVEDVVQAFLLAIENYDEMKGQAYNVGLSSANLSKLELAQKIAEHTECHIVEAEFMQDPDKRDYLVSNDKIEQLGFAPEWDLDRTIKQLVRFYKTVDLASANIFYENW